MYLKVFENPYLEPTETDSGGWNLTSSHFDVLLSVIFTVRGNPVCLSTKNKNLNFLWEDFCVVILLYS